MPTQDVKDHLDPSGDSQLFKDPKKIILHRMFAESEAIGNFRIG
jgi:hypothetical protein